MQCIKKMENPEVIKKGYILPHCGENTKKYDFPSKSIKYTLHFINIFSVFHYFVYNKSYISFSSKVQGNHPAQVV